MIPAIHIMNLRTLDLNLLLVFEALMDERNVTRAGQPKEGSRMRLPEQVSKKREVTSSPVAEGSLLTRHNERQRTESSAAPLAIRSSTNLIIAEAHSIRAPRWPTH